MIDSHPALCCSSPQAPISDMWLGDDFHHNGCCYLAHTFGFLVGDGHGKAINHSSNRQALLARISPRAAVGAADGPAVDPTVYRELDYGTDDGYEFFMQVGPLRNLAATMDESGPMLRERGASNLWPDMVEHDNYDAFWQHRAIRHHLNNVHCAVLVVGGWFDCEDTLGPFSVFEES